MFLDILEFEIENIKTFWENCFENMLSEIHKNDLFCFYNPPKIRNAFFL